MKMKKKKTRNDKRWYIRYSHTVNGYYVVKDGFQYNWYDTEYEAKQVRDGLNEEDI